MIDMIDDETIKARIIDIYDRVVRIEKKIDEMSKKLDRIHK